MLLVAGLATAAAVGSTTLPATPEAGPDLSGHTQHVRVPFARMGRAPTTDEAATRPAVNFDHLTGLNVRVSVNGGPPLKLQVDTGSVGIIVSAAAVPDIDPHAPPGQMVYSSSGNGFYGVWTPATVTFLDATGDDGKPVTAQCPVLAAQEYRFTPGAVNGGGATSRPVRRNPQVFMCGMGFGRGLDPHPERNPFINLTAMRAGTMRRGYALTRDGITLGLTAADVAPGPTGQAYRWQHLTERKVSAEAARLAPGCKDWATSRGWIVVDGHREPDTAILIDTGLTNFMIPTWAGITNNVELPRGTRVEVDLLGGQLHYGFVSVDAKDKWAAGQDPVTPLKVTRYPTTNPAANVNTGLRPLAIYDYCYDADGGYLGLRPTVGHR